MKRKLLLLYGFIPSVILLNGQHKMREKINHEDYELVESYSIEETTKLNLPKGYSPKDVYEMDKILFEPRKEVKHIVKQLDKKGDIVTTIYYDRPSHVEKWVILPYKTVFYEDRVISYGHKGEILLENKVDKITKEKFKDVKKLIIANKKFQNVNFDNFENEEKKDFQKRGAKYKKISFYGEELDFDTIVYRNVPEKLIKQSIYKDKTLKEKASISEKYRKNDEGVLFLSNRTESAIKTISSSKGDKMEVKEVVNAKIYDYKFYSAEKSKLKPRASENVEPEYWKLISNPIQDNFIGLMRGKESSEHYEMGSIFYEIFRVDGSLLNKNEILETYDKASIDVSMLKSGLYILRIRYKEIEEPAIKFIKI